VEEIFLFLALILKIGHNQCDTLKEYWSRDPMSHAPFYSRVIRHNRFFHILWFLHFENNEDAPDRNRGEYDMLWKLRRVFDYLNARFAKVYIPTEQLAIDEIIVKFKGNVVFCQFIPKKRKRFGIKLYKLCDSLGYTYDMKVYLGKQREDAAGNVTATHGTVLQLVRRLENKVHTLYMDNYFSLPHLFDDLHNRRIGSCDTFHHNRKEMPSNFGPKHLKLKKRRHCI
jgi:hypothetical protein